MRKIWILFFLMLVVGCQSAYQYKGARLDPPLAVPDFELNDTNNQPFRLSDVNADVILVYFGYTFCPDVCPLTMWDVKKVLTDLEGRERVQVIFISVDPERDTPEALARYLAGFDPQFIGLTDDYDNTQEVLKPFGAFAEKEDVSGSSSAEYLVNHTARLYLLNANQEILLTYPFGFETDDLRSDLAHLLQQSKQ